MIVFTESPSDHSKVRVHGSGLDYFEARKIARIVGGVVMFTDQFNESVKRGDRTVAK
jgi:hypothetical protein